MPRGRRTHERGSRQVLRFPWLFGRSVAPPGLPISGWLETPRNVGSMAEAVDHVRLTPGRSFLRGREADAIRLRHDERIHATPGILSGRLRRSAGRWPACRRFVSFTSTLQHGRSAGLGAIAEVAHYDAL